MPYITDNPAITGYTAMSQALNRQALTAADLSARERQQAQEDSVDAALRGAIAQSRQPAPADAAMSSTSLSSAVPSGYPVQQSPDFVGALAKSPGGGRLALSIDQADTARKDAWTEKAMRALGTGDMATYDVYSKRAGLVLPLEVLNNAEVAQSVARSTDVADKIYGKDFQQAHAFVSAYMQAQGTPAQRFTAALQQVGPPRDKPEWTLADANVAGQNVLAFYDRASRGTPTVDVTNVAKARPEVQDRYLPQQTTDASGAETVGSFNERTGEVKVGTVPGTVHGWGTRGGANSVYQQKMDAWLQLHPGDQAGALQYASGQRRMGEAEMMHVANTMARNEAMTMANPGPTYVRQRTDEIYAALRSANGASATPSAASGSMPQTTQGGDGKPWAVGPDGRQYRIVNTDADAALLHPGETYFSPSEGGFFTKD